MTVQRLDPGSPDSSGYGHDGISAQVSNAKLLHHKRLVLVWALMVLLPLALVRLSLFHVYPERMGGDRNLSAELQQMIQSVNLSALPSHRSGGCDLLQGEWIPDEVGPTYSNETCNHIQGHQNCLKNGRPDNGYMFWRWKPDDCELPRFNTTLFIELMRGKLMAFVGDSIARNHMQALLCTLSQIEKPIKTYTDEGDRHVRWWFPSNNFTVSTFWSPYLAFQTDDESHGIEKGHSKLFLDKLDPVWLANITQFDVLILSSGQWFFKNNLFFQNNTLIGCHHCPGFNITNLGFYFAYREILKHVLVELPKLQGFKGLAILRSFSPDHFEDGRWDNGGSCKRTVPFHPNRTIPTDSLTFEMHRIQREVFDGLERADRVAMVDVTQISYLRPDGHPGPYRNFQPFSKEFVGHVQNDCLHWCIPGPVDTWNDMVLETMRQQLI
ncbi:protein trichome birefringence-like 23 [Selaginella moellendorffii]|uniref:protein trichome birefringence-like 23 n=1 Tax=Selaginella moellendorffii TaxID=88036 RepID=UPI000D1C7B4A|nr:protein trichome birefringence-like 23 [Selaginella moellendorffii]XP_024523300.1 protein trichome birefringence-like 23 [Selaginella moellendorffii]|eukprot:XP_024523299.1 protein trichome birefringence-like 23 [Selaginella moellendorffii]